MESMGMRLEWHAQHMHKLFQGRGEQDDTHIPPSCDERRVATGEEGRRERGEVVKREGSERRQELRAEYTVTDLPECYRGYEALLEGDTTPTTAIPTGMYIHVYTCTAF